jgi:hypothetical protein
MSVRASGPAGEKDINDEFPKVVSAPDVNAGSPTVLV